MKITKRLLTGDSNKLKAEIMGFGQNLFVRSYNLM